MKNNLLSIFLIFAFVISAQAQEIRAVNTKFSDYLPLLNNAGYVVYSYDISSLKDTTYQITFSVKEYVKGQLIEGKGIGFTPVFTNRRMLSVFSERDQKNIIEKGTAYDADKGIYKLCDRITVGFSPAADSVKNAMFNVNNIGSFFWRLALKPMDAPGYEGTYHYDIRPFKIEEFKTGEFIPLLLVGSFWWDEKFQIIRFCGESEFSPSMQSETIDKIPHYFVIGITLSL